MSGARVSNLANRRTFLKYGLAAWAAAAAIGPMWGKAAGRYYKAIFDERFDDSRAFAAGAGERRIPTAAIRGDITKLFLDDLDPRWKKGPVVLAGYTTPASLFCLDLLARDRGMRVRHCTTEPSVQAALGVLDGALPHRLIATPLPSGRPSPLVFWILAPS